MWPLVHRNARLLRPWINHVIISHGRCSHSHIWTYLILVLVLTFIHDTGLRLMSNTESLQMKYLIIKIGLFRITRRLRSESAT